MLTGLPDLAVPLPVAAGSVYALHGVPGMAAALPDRLELHRLPGGTPALLVTVLHEDSDPKSEESGPQTVGGRLEAAFTIAADLGPLGRELAAHGKPVRLTTADPDEGVLTAGVHSGPVPGMRRLGAEVSMRAVVRSQLTVEQAEAAAGLVRDGLLPVTVALRLAFRVVAARLPLALTFDPRAVAQRLAERFGVEATLSTEDLTTGIGELLGGPVIEVHGDAAATGPASRTAALRLRDRFTEPGPAHQVIYRLRPVADVPDGSVRVDLAEPAAVTVHRLLVPDAAATNAVAGTPPQRLVRHVTVPALPAGRHRISVTAGLPEPVAGLRTLFADLRTPAEAAQRTPDQADQRALTEVVVAELAEGGNGAGERNADLVIGPPSGEVRLRAVVDAAGSTREVAGPWQVADSERLVLGPSAFPAPLTVVRVSAALTGIATVEVSVGGRTVVRLDAGTAEAAVCRWAGGEAPRVVVRPRGDGRPVEMELPARPRVELDPVVLPGYGAHRARFTAGSAAVSVEWLPDGAAESMRTSARIGADRPHVDVTWVATSPFRPGLRWRVVRDGVAADWSDPVSPADGLVIAVSTDPPEPEPELLRVDGIELRQQPGERGVWVYLPPGPLLERQADGRPAIGLIEAGPVAFLQLTSRLDIDRDGLLLRLRQQRPDATVVRPEPIDVQGVHLEARPSAAGWTVVAGGRSSGLPPWTTAMAATLTGDQLAAVKAALGGTRERLRLRAVFTVPATPQTTRSTSSTTRIRAAGPAGVSEMSTQSGSVTAAAAGPRSVEQIRDVADLVATDRA